MQNNNTNHESKLLQTILVLRQELAGEEITLKGYNNKVGKLLAGVDEDTKKRFTELERALNDGDIDSSKYEKQLAAIFQYGETHIAAFPQVDEVTVDAVNTPQKTTYDVFLSYSHRDRDEYGMEYIQRIKEEIEKALEGIVEQPRVFLDAEALVLGEMWHSKIMESLRQCKVFVCLVSEQYLKSEYSTRERLWWNAKQTHDGRLLGEGPYPVYYVKLEGGLFSERPDVKELMATQMDCMPWFEFKAQLQEDFIRERLESITTVVRRKARAANQAFQSFCSVRPPLCDNFVGRVTELRELHELCANGKYPIIQAAGGVGKTELSVAYAYGFADHYPMGRFLIHMEGIRNWDDAFSTMLDMNGEYAEGVSRKVSDELGIDDDTLKKSAVDRHHAATEALLRRAQTGKLLILLDNLDDENLLTRARMRDFLCDSQIPRNIHILATTRSTIHFGKRDTCTSFELANLKEDEAFEMLCLTGNGQYPFDMQPPSTENKEYQAAHEVIQLLDGHAWSMEIISAFMAENYDSEGFTFEMELEKLKNGLSSIKGSTYREKARHSTAALLLQPTFDKLASLELGNEAMKLLTFASCFNPDDIPIAIMKAYWQQFYPNVECSKGKPFFFILKQLKEYHLLFGNGESYKMHRLLQSVLLEYVHPLVEEFGSFLHGSYLIEQSSWVDLLLNVQELFEYCPKEVLSPNVWIKLVANSFFVNKCPWNLLDGNNWSDLLQAQPQFADKCPWEKLDGMNWSCLLWEQPQFEERCIWDKLNGLHWIILLDGQPQFADKCPWEKLNRKYLFTLLQKFADKCPLDKLNGTDWCMLLWWHPHFSDKCPWDKLNGEDWSVLLVRQPQFADKCPWDKFSSKDWSRLLAWQPQFDDRCQWDMLSGSDWCRLLQKQPHFADRCPWDKLDGASWSELLSEQPQFAEYCLWEKLNSKDWSVLLSNQPLFAEYCLWEKLNSTDWSKLLCKQPQFADRCPWGKLDGNAWSRLLQKQPHFATQCPWDRLDGNNWASLLQNQPQFATKCPWHKLNGKNWSNLLRKQPQFADKCQWDKLNGKDWSNLLQKQPQFADKCVWEKLENKDWDNLLKRQPQFADKRPKSPSI